MKPTKDEVIRAIDTISNLADSFLTHWEEDDDVEEKRAARKARFEYEMALSVLDSAELV